MINLINRNTQISALVAAKVEVLTSETRGETFKNILSGIIQSKNASSVASSIDSAYSASYVSDEETELSVTDQLPKTADKFTEYVTIEINGQQYRQPTDEYLTYLGYDVEIMKANALDVDLLAYATRDGIVPKYVIPVDMRNETNYAETLTNSDNLAQTTNNNADFDSWLSSRTVNISTVNSNTTEQSHTSEVVEESISYSNVYKSQNTKNPVNNLYLDYLLSPTIDTTAVNDVIVPESVVEKHISQTNNEHNPSQNIANLATTYSVNAWVTRMLSNMDMLNLRVAKN